MSRRVLILHGPNLNLLGKREPLIYGSDTLEEVNEAIGGLAQEEGMEVEILQSNHEGELVDALHRLSSWADVLIINPGALGHTSISLRDAIAATGIAAIEVHLSNIYKREGFRHHSFVAEVAVGQISGFGKGSYLLAIQAASQILRAKESAPQPKSDATSITPG